MRCNCYFVQMNKHTHTWPNFSKLHLLACDWIRQWLQSCLWSGCGSCGPPDVLICEALNLFPPGCKKSLSASRPSLSNHYFDFRHQWFECGRASRTTKSSDAVFFESRTIKPSESEKPARFPCWFLSPHLQHRELGLAWQAEFLLLWWVGVEAVLVQPALKNLHRLLGQVAAATPLPKEPLSWQVKRGAIVTVRHGGGVLVLGAMVILWGWKKRKPPVTIAQQNKYLLWSCS